MTTTEDTHATSSSLKMADFLEILTDALDSLHDLSSSFAERVPMDMLTDPVLQTIEELAETFDVAHVEAKYPSAPLPLVWRLGNMNIRRRSYLSYQKRKKAAPSLQSDPGTPASKAIGSSARSRISRSTDPSTVLSSAPSVFDSPVNVNHLGTVDSRSSASMSQPLNEARPDYRPINLPSLPATEPAALSDAENSAGSVTSFATTITPSSEARVRVPKPPPGFYEDEPFECLYCLRTLKTVKTHRSWKYDARAEPMRYR